MLKIFSKIKEKINEQTLMHWVKGAGDNTGYLRVPNNPIGVAVREQGQVDLYSGPTRFILGIDGSIYEKGRTHILATEEFHILVKDIKNFTILNKYINDRVFAGKPIATVTNAGVREYNSPEGLNFVRTQAIVRDFASNNPIGYIDPNSIVPLSSILNFELLFESEETTLVPIELEMLSHFNKLRKGL